MPTSAEYTGMTIFASVAALMIYGAKRKAMMLPTADEQAWLDAQLATPPGQKLTQEEQKWLDKQMQDAQDAEMLDDARQAAYAPGEGSSPHPSPAKTKKGK